MNHDPSNTKLYGQPFPPRSIRFVDPEHWLPASRSAQSSAGVAPDCTEATHEEGPRQGHAHSALFLSAGSNPSYPLRPGNRLNASGQSTWSVLFTFPRLPLATSTLQTQSHRAACCLARCFLQVEFLPDAHSTQQIHNMSEKLYRYLGKYLRLEPTHLLSPSVTFCPAYEPICSGLQHKECTEASVISTCTCRYLGAGGI
jgi:hypothetical protein